MVFDFSQNTTVESIDKIPEDFQPFYKENDEGGFTLDTENPVVKKSVSVIAGLTKSLGASRKEAKEAKGAQIDLSTLSEFGATPEEIAAGFASRIEELQTASGKKSETEITRKIEAIKADLLKASAKTVSDRDVRIEALTNQLYKQMVEAQAVAALEGKAVSAELALPFVRKFIKVTETEGQFKVQVVDENGDERHGGTGNSMTIPELVAEMRGQERYKPLFKSEAPAGGGTPPGGPSRRVPVKSGSDLSPTGKIAVGLAKGQHSRAAGV